MDEKAMMLIAVLGLVTLVVSIGLFVVIPLIFRRKRREAMRGASQRLGFTFYPEGEGFIVGQLGDFEFFAQPGHKRISNVMERRGKKSLVMIMDCRIRTGSGQHSFVENETVLMIESNQLNSPRFTMQPEHMGLRLIGSTAGEDIDFPGRPTFNQKYFLRGPDPMAVRQFFSEKLLTFFEIHQGLRMEGAGNRFLLWRHNKRVTPDDLEFWIRLGKELLRVLVVEE